MATGSRLAIGSAIVLSVTAYMTFLGASSSWQYYLTVDECLTNASALLHKPIRVSGEIAVDSLSVAKDRGEAQFSLAGTKGNLCVNCTGQLPDNLAEGRQVVVEGRLQSTDHLAGDRVLARCASKYTSQVSVAVAEEIGPGNAE